MGSYSYLGQENLEALGAFLAAPRVVVRKTEFADRESDRAKIPEGAASRPLSLRCQ